MTTFQCDLCVFWNLHNLSPFKGAPKDELLLCCICWVNLDVLWGCQSGMVKATAKEYLAIISPV